MLIKMKKAILLAVAVMGLAFAAKAQNNAIHPFHFAGAAGAVGQVGMDYHFNAIPFQLSLDFRPCLFLIPNTVFQWADFGLSVQYRF